MIGEGDKAKLADFGLARIAPDLARESVSQINTDTRAGTPGYMAPELVMAGNVSARTDSFSFGIVLLQLLTGKPPANPVTREMVLDELADVMEDPARLQSADLDPAAGAWRIEQARATLRIAVRCTRARTAQRCEAREVVRELDELAGRAGASAAASEPAPGVAGCDHGRD